MLKLRYFDQVTHKLGQTAQSWQQQGAAATLTKPPHDGLWLRLNAEEAGWAGWIQPRVWLEHVAPQLAGLALSAGVERLAAQWLAAGDCPLTMPVPGLAARQLTVGEVTTGDALPDRPLLRIATEEGPVWLDQVPPLSPRRRELPALRWPLRFVIGESLASFKLLHRVAIDDVLLIRARRAQVRCHDKTLGSYQSLEEGIIMEWTEPEPEQKSLTQMPVRDLGRLPVQLEFVLHQTLLTLVEIQELASGQLLQLPADIEQRVEVRANGALLGRGELVQLDGHLGVEIREWLDRLPDAE